MADHLDDLDDVDDLDDELLRRLRTGMTGIHPRHDALAVVQHQVGRRQRRRRVVAAVASVAVAAVVVPLAVVALQVKGGDDVDPAEPSPTGLALNGTNPVAFFVSLAGGRGRGQAVFYRKAPGQRYYARFLWFPEADGTVPLLSGVAVESFYGTPADRCAELVAADVAGGATSSCETTSDGHVVRIADTTGADVRIDGLNRRGKLKQSGADDPVRAVTVFRDDNWAVSLVVCQCAAWNRPDPTSPPRTGLELADVASDEAWVPDPDAPGRVLDSPTS